MLIVDSQVHIWGADTPERPWPKRAPPQRPVPLGKDELLREMDAAGVDRVIIVPPSWEGDRNDLALDAVKRYPGRFAIMGRLDPDAPGAREQMARWKQQPGMLGVRLPFQNDMMKLLTEGHANWFWPMAEKLGLPVMFFAPRNIPKFASVAERHPGLTMIIDHMSLNQEIAKEGKIKESIDTVVAMAKYPNVSVKISSAPTYSFDPYPWRDMTEHVKRLFEAYGPQRSYWGTDLTNAYSKSTYRQRITHFTEELPFLSEADKDWVMGKAILQTLKWA